MTMSENGYTPQKGFMETALSKIHDLNSKEMPEYDLIEYDPLLDSTNITVKVWMKIARDIEERYDMYHGFVILHGTDTMAYTASALSFMLDGLSKPIIFTGAQIPLSEIRNDGRDNLITALILAANYDIPEVCIFFENKLFRGNRTTKVSADELFAFDSPNYSPLAEVGVNINLNEKLIRKPGNSLKVCTFEKHQIAVLKIFPGIELEVFNNIMTPNLKGIVIETFGAGNIPKIGGVLDGILKKAMENKTVIVVCTECLRGSATMGQYESSNGLSKAGTVSGYDMTIEAAVTKLDYLLSLNCDLNTVKELMGKNLRGELEN
ncbi:asparaginase [Alkalibaculum sp. M08DMB]|uniref:asparaginase n=2 Tax=Alkalibaculum sporogenes TaxID=2655001 RepID=A0A6A7K8K8_9FIRM|nr:asparaginase [Alkalibaculum sporogenes]